MSTVTYDATYQAVMDCVQSPTDTPILRRVAERLGISYESAGQRISRLRKAGYDMRAYDAVVAEKNTAPRPRSAIAAEKSSAFYQTLMECARTCEQGKIVEAISARTGLAPTNVSRWISRLRARGYDVSAYDRLIVKSETGVTIQHLRARIAELEQQVSELSAALKKK